MIIGIISSLVKIRQTDRPTDRQMIWQTDRRRDGGRIDR